MTKINKKNEGRVYGLRYAGFFFIFT